MTRVLVQWVRDTDGDFTAFAVWHGTATCLSSLVRPGHPFEGMVRRIHDTARPPCLDDGCTRATWEDWIGHALDALAHGHDLMASEVPPEPTLERTYARWVLGLGGAALERWRPARPPTVTLWPVADRVIGAAQSAWSHGLPEGWHWAQDRHRAPYAPSTGRRVRCLRPRPGDRGAP